MMGLLLYNNRQGQAATELAVFGAIIIFLIGGIVRSSISASFQQNQQLKAMRQALLMSYQGREGAGRTTGHNSTSVMYIEDRITPDVGRYGSPDRAPFIMTGSGTLTNMLMFPLDLPDVRDERNLSVMDVFINGQHFTFSTQGLEDRDLTPPSVAQCPGSSDNPAGNGTTHCGGWDFRCKQDSVGNWLKCPLFYQMSITPGGDYGVLTEAEAYDLNRNDIFAPLDTQDPGAPGKPAIADMDWHWKAVKGLQGNISIDTAAGNYPSWDIFNHKQEGTVYAINYDGNGIATHAIVLDTQSADLDTTRDSGASTMQYGLQKDMNIYTMTTAGSGKGAYFQLKEGKLYNPETGVYVRSANSKDQVELIERRFLLSNDTGRMCQGGVPSKNPVEVCASTWQNCFTGDNIKLTCFGQSQYDPENPNSRMLFIRSRVLDKRGLFFKTDATGALP